MESVPEYHAEPDRAAAFGRWEKPARDAGYRLLQLLLDKRSTVILDHSGAVPGHVDLLEYAREVGEYLIVVVRLLTAPEVAHRRMSARYAAGGRFVPSHYIAERDAAISALVPRYRRIANEYMEIPNDADGAAGLRNLESACLRLARQVTAGRSK
jgi:predicted ABC-type ATPase